MRWAQKNSLAAIVIRRATTADANDVATVYIASRRAAAAWMPTVHTDAEIRAWVVDYMVPNTETWVAETAGRIVATMVLDGEMQGDMQHHMIDQLYVSPADQR